MIFAGHRLSRDIDGVIDDPQSLALLSPETTDVYETIRRIGPTRIVRFFCGRRLRMHRGDGFAAVDAKRASS